MSRGKEKALVLTESGEEYSERLLHSLSLMEERAAAQLGARADPDDDGAVHGV